MEKIKIMTYNVQHFSGINSQVDMQKRIMNKYNANVIGIQELTTTGRINSVGKAALAGYQYKYLSSHKNYLGLASRCMLNNVKSRDFKNQDPEDMAMFNETRAFMTASLEIGNKKIVLINAHLSYLTPEVKFLQMGELFTLANRYTYTVIMGDFNCFADQVGCEEFNRMFGQFVNAGYHLANGKMRKTWTNKNNPKWLSQFTYPTDNIITSPNINIKKVYFDKIKLSYPNGDMMDHVPIIARLIVH